MSASWAIIEDNSEILLIRRSFAVGRAGQWCPPGGTVRDDEDPAVACVREAFEETSLRISIREKLGSFGLLSHYYLCKLNTGRDALELRSRECIGAQWVKPENMLEIGTIMDLRRLLPILKIAGLRMPAVPAGLELCWPDGGYIYKK